MSKKTSKNMKQLLTICLAVTLLFCLGACGATGDGAPAAGNQGEQQTPADAVSPTEGTGDTPAVQPEEPQSATGSNVLIAYFSCTGNTEGIAETVAQTLEGDLYEIQPAEPYTSEDLDYNNDASRCSQEHNDAASRPAISGGVEDMASYDVVFLGYPIWWGEAPRIISTFLESYDFSGKTIVPFCTSSSSGIGNSALDLHGLCSDTVTWLDGARFSGNASSTELEEWLGGLGLETRTE